MAYEKDYEDFDGVDDDPEATAWFAQHPEEHPNHDPEEAAYWAAHPEEDRI